MVQESVSMLLPNGIRLTIIPTAKFKTISMALFIHQELAAEKATFTALLPSVLERGSRQYPDNLTLRRELEQLYGAELTTGVHKKGERHLISCSLEMMHGKYVGEGEQMLRRGLSILGGVIGDPLVVNGGFKEEYVVQEKEQLEKTIRSLINDKALYAVERCLQEMCAEERYGVFKYGRIEDLEKIDPASLWRYYRELLSTNPMELYIVGDLDAKQAEEVARETLYFSRGPQRNNLPETAVYVEPAEARFIQEKMPVGQAKLVLGYRTNIAYDDPLYFPLVLYNGILGGFPHSKLFLNVREKASLAYYVYSRLEKQKGIMLIAAGIEGNKYEMAREIIESQVEAMARGQISELELENSRRGLINRLRVQEDNPYQHINRHLDGEVGGKKYSTAEMIRALEEVGLNDIKAVAEKIGLDTVYLLQGEEGVLPDVRQEQ
ncbi:MAG: pitrilysin family protein [Dethiobacteria bacterium]|nr:pitrilysin family protein [Bacillota bacterium]NMD33595.1 insulinase family protein [Bacillota bacterium]HOB28500.1 pitrilysin family protein [Bacillota bacterium]HPZ41086.1 pitrilysin family protein [Bacillota bacterium]HQD52178.1 pitrilysin family protein [Bacillota bacterium]